MKEEHGSAVSHIDSFATIGPWSKDRDCTEQRIENRERQTASPIFSFKTPAGNSRKKEKYRYSPRWSTGRFYLGGRFSKVDGNIRAISLLTANESKCHILSRFFTSFNFLSFYESYKN